MLKAISSAKINLPLLRSDSFYLKRMTQCFNEGLGMHFTIVTAPAGYGKTTYVTSWLKEGQIPTIWISLDEDDNSIVSFISYLCSAISRVKPQEMEKIETVISQFKGDTYTNDFFLYLIQEIKQILDGFVFVFDNYQEIKNPEIHRFMESFLLNLIPISITNSDRWMGCHPMILSRSKPLFPLPKWRLDGIVNEISIKELQLSPEESTQFIKQIAPPTLSKDEISSLVDKCEGWISGLRMATVFLVNREQSKKISLDQDVGSVNNSIIDYFVHEVLENQPKEIQNFLVKTSVLEEMHHSLCDAVLGQSKSQIILEELVDNNLFIISLDDQKSRFRYHRMFKEVLINQQKRLDLEELQEIHTKAAIWLEEHGEIESSFKHWISAKGADEAAKMLIRNGPKMLGEFQRPIFIELTNSLPRDVVLRWPWLSVFRAWCSAIFDSQSVQVWLGLAEDGINQRKNIGEEIIDEDELMGNIIAIEVIQASMLGDREKTIQLANKALQLLPEQATNVRGLVHKAIGTSAQSGFDLDSALDEYLQSVTELRKRKNLVGAIDSQNMAADVLVIQGKLHKANKMFREALTFDESLDPENLPYFSKSFSEIGLILYEWNRLEEAFDNLIQGYVLSKKIGGPSQVEMGINLVFSYLSLGEIEKASEYLKEIEAVTQWKSFFPYLESHLAAVKIHFLTKTGNLLEAKRIINERSIQCDCLVDFYQEIECMALAFHYFYTGDMLSSINQASKLSKCMEEGGRNGRRIKMLVLEASAQLTLQHRDRAIELINTALEIGQQGTYIRAFVDQGEPILEILVWVLNKFSEVTYPQIDLEYLRLIIDAFLGQPNKPSSHIQVRAPDIDKKHLIDPLTDREQKVLRMMSIGLSNKEIAKELELTVHTIKTHARHIYRKLGVNNRTQAVYKGKILGII